MGVAAVAKLDKAATAADDSERARKVFQSKADEDEKRITGLEKELKEAREKAEAADAHYDDVAKKLATCESELEKAEERAETGETKIMELEEELRVVANNLKSLEVAEEKANQREKTYKEQIKTLSAKLKQAEARAELPRSLFRNFRRRWTGCRMSSSPSRRSTRPSLRSWSRPSQRCPDTRLSDLFFHTDLLILLCFTMRVF